MQSNSSDAEGRRVMFWLWLGAAQIYRTKCWTFSSEINALFSFIRNLFIRKLASKSPKIKKDNRKYVDPVK